MYESDYRNIDEMKYLEAQEYLSKRAIEISGFESFMNGVKYPHFWKYFVRVWLYYSVMGFLCSFVYTVAVKRENAI